MLSSVATVVLAGLVTVACTGVGLQVLPRLGFRFGSWSETLVFSTGAGLVLLIWALIPLGFLGWLYPAVAWTLLASFLVAGAPRLWRFRPRPWRALFLWAAYVSWPIKVLLLLGLFYALGYLLSGLYPSLDGDSLHGYLILPREYASQHALVVVDYAYGYYYPQNAQLLSTLGFLLQGEALAVTLVSFVTGLLSGVAVYSLGRSYFGREAGIIGAVAFYGMFAFGFVSGSAKVDLAWAFFDLLGIIAFSRWYFGTEARARWLVLAGVFVGVGLAIKYSSLFTIAALGAALMVTSLVRRRTGTKRVLLDSLAFGVPIALSALWLVRTYLLTDNPVYPMFNSLILDTHTGEIGLTQYDNILLFPRILWDMSMGWIAGGMGKPIGPILLAAIPMLLLFRGVDWRIKHILLFCLLAAGLWFFGLQRARHILPILALLSVVAGYATFLMLQHQRPLGLTLVALAIVALSMNSVIWARSRLPVPESITYAAGLQTRQEFLAAKIGEYFWYPDYDVLQYISNVLPSDARLVGNPSSGAAYYVDRPIYGRLLYTSVSSQETLCDLKAHDIDHMWVNFDIIDYLNPKSTSGGQPVYWSEDAEFRTAYLSELYSNGPQSVYQVRYPDTLDCSDVQLQPWYP